MYDEHEASLKLIISQQKWICLTADIWSCKNRSFLGVSVHFMDNDLKRQSYVISCKDFPAPHNYETITESFQLIYSKFGINSESVIATVTDNASNFVKAFQIFGRNNDEFVKFLQTEEDDALDESENFEESDRAGIFKILNTLYNEPDQIDANDETEVLSDLLYLTDRGNSQDDNDVTRNLSDVNKPEKLQEFIRSRITNIPLDVHSALALSNRISCNAHNFNLIGSSDSLRAHRNKQYSKTYETVFEKLNMLWHYSGLQESSQIIIKHLGSNLNKPSRTRWNDIYLKVISLFSHKNFFLFHSNNVPSSIFSSTRYQIS